MINHPGVMARLPRAAVALATAGALMSLGACGGGADPTSTTQDSVRTVRVAVPATAAPFLDVYVAQEKGYFEAHKVKIELTQSQQGPSGVVNAVVAGASDIGIPSTGVSIQALAKGAKIKAIATGASKTVTRLVGAKDLKNPTDLRGKKIAVTSTSDTITYGMEQYLLGQGLARSDYEQIVVPSSADRLAALTSGGASAADLAPPLDIQALGQGYSDLGLIIAADTFCDHIASESFLAKDAALAADYVAAINDAHAWLNDPANEQEAGAILAKNTKLKEELAAKGAKLFLDNKVFLPTAQVHVAGIEESIKAVDALGQLSKPITPEDYIDNRPFEEATK